MYKNLCRMVKDGGKVIPVLIIMSIFLLPAKAAIAEQPAKIDWNPKRLELEVPLGWKSQEKISFVSDRDTGPLRLEVVPALSDYLNIEPREIESVQAGEKVQITVTAAFDTNLNGSEPG